ncbi:hypothetical protein QY96_00299 [Bacillus thermotolerans]|nr:hypothetical protein QY96_00299 [Bacillus thermotolerans]
MDVQGRDGKKPLLKDYMVEKQLSYGSLCEFSQSLLIDKMNILN